MTKKPKVNGPNNTIIKAFDNYYNDDNIMENLLTDFHTKLFRHSHFRIYNRHRSYRLTHNRIVDNTDIIFKIQVHQDNPLIVSYFQIENPS